MLAENWGGVDKDIRIPGKTVRVLKTLSGLALVASVVLVIVLPANWLSIIWVAAMTSVAILLGSLWLILLARRKAKEVRNREPLAKNPDMRLLSARIEAYYRGIDERRARFFSTIVLDPGKATLRISETATPFEGHINIVSNVSIQLPRDYPGNGSAVPLVFKSRNTLTDGLKVTRDDGRRKSTLTQVSSIAFEAAVCRRLVASAGGRRLLQQYRLAVEPEVLTVLSSQRFEEEATIAELGAAIEGMLAGRSHRHKDALIRVYLLVHQLWTAYPILVAVDEPATSSRGEDDLVVRYTVEQDLVLSRKAFNSKGSGPQSWLARWASNVKLFLLLLLGLKPADISIPLDNADRCQSYHLQCKLPDGRSYLGDQRVEPMGTPVANVSPIRGQSYSHLYVTDGSGFGGRLFRNWFYEVPPGSSGVAAMVGAAVLFGLSFLAIHQLNWANDAAGFGSATLLLGLPGTVIALFGVGRTAGFFQGSFLGRLSTLVSLTTSLAAITAVALFERNTSHYPDLAFDDLRKLPADLIFWMVLVAAQLVNLIVAVSAWVYWTYLYWALKRSYAEGLNKAPAETKRTSTTSGG